MKAAMDDIYMNPPGCLPVKTLFAKAVSRHGFSNNNITILKYQ
jgi:hypothetical protein